MMSKERDSYPCPALKPMSLARIKLRVHCNAEGDHLVIGPEGTSVAAPSANRTVQRVLDAASSLLEQMPLEDVTTTRIAAEAGLSIGALYRFFPDKQTIIDAIAVRHVEQFRASLEGSVMKVLERELANLETFDPALMLDSVVDAYIVYFDAHPDFRTISFGRYISAATKRTPGVPQCGTSCIAEEFHARAAGYSQHAGT